jgi:hypothetical protein
MGHWAKLEIEHQFFDTDRSEMLDKFETIFGAAHGEAGGLHQIMTGKTISTAGIGALRGVEFAVVWCTRLRPFRN